MKVLLASPYGGTPGGMTRWTEHILNYYEHLDRGDISIDLLPMGRKSFVNINSSICYRLRTAYRDYREIIFRFKKMLSCVNYDILHLASSASISLIKDLYMLSYAKKLGIKTCIHFHFGRIPELSKRKNWEWNLLLKVVKLSDCVIVLDKKSYETLKSIGFDKIYILPNPVAPVVSELIAENNSLIRGNNTILFTGHVVRTKGVVELLDACMEIPHIKLRLVGHIEENMRDFLLSRCNNAGWLEIVGEEEYSDVIMDMLKCDIFVLPTYTEGFPNVILESMACGCAIVTTNVGAIPEMLEEDSCGKYGILIEPRNVIQLRESIIRMLNNPDLKQMCKSNVVRRVNERYNISSVWKQLFGIWNSLK